MDDLQLKCALANLSKKITNYQLYVEKALFENKQECKKEIDKNLKAVSKYISEEFEVIANALNDIIKAQLEFLGEDIPD